MADPLSGSGRVLESFGRLVGRQATAPALVQADSLAAVLALHAPHRYDAHDTGWHCRGCDVAPHGDPPDWPCTTVTTIIERLGGHGG